MIALTGIIMKFLMMTLFLFSIATVVGILFVPFVMIAFYAYQLFVYFTLVGYLYRREHHAGNLPAPASSRGLSF